MSLARVAAIAALFLSSSPVLLFAQPAATGLRIVAIEGEDAVNIIQQKTAVAPIVEVRDSNNLPMPGVAVTFSLSGGSGATFGGASTLTVVTNAAGQATAAGLTPTATGAIQISATATVQGQTAVLTIAQSNVLTAAEAAATAAGGGASGSGGAAGAGTGAGAGGGGGLSATTIGIIGAAAGGGLAVAGAAGGGDDGGSSTTSTTPGGTAATAPPATSTPAPTTPAPPPTTPAPPPTQQPTSSSFTGPMDGTLSGTSIWSFVGDEGINCNISVRNTGNAAMRLQTASSGAITGTLEMNGQQIVSAANCGVASHLIPDTPFMMTANVEGSGNTVRFTQEFRDSQSFSGASFTMVATISFTGTISGGAMNGALNYNSTVDFRGDGFSGRATMTGTINLNLR